MLNAIAVAGKTVPLTLLTSTLSIPLNATAVVTHMRNERLVRLVGSFGEEQLVDTYHDKIRETMLDEMSDESCRELHARFANALLRKLKSASVSTEMPR